MYNTVYLYGFAGARDAYRAKHYVGINPEDLFSDATHERMVSQLKYEAEHMQRCEPDIVEVWMVDSHRGLKKEYDEAKRKNTIESHAIFKDLVTGNGIRIL